MGISNHKNVHTDLQDIDVVFWLDDVSGRSVCGYTEFGFYFWNKDFTEGCGPFLTKIGSFYRLGSR